MIPETRIERRDVASLTPADYNPRQISERAMSGLRESVTRFGLVQPVIINERTGNVVGGHQRVRVLQAEGVESVDVVVVDIPASEERALNVAMNNPHISGEFTDTLDSLLEGIQSETPDLFDALRLDDLMGQMLSADVPDGAWPEMHEDVTVSTRTFLLSPEQAAVLDAAIADAKANDGVSSNGDALMHLLDVGARDDG